MHLGEILRQIGGNLVGNHAECALCCGASRMVAQRIGVIIAAGGNALTSGRSKATRCA